MNVVACCVLTESCDELCESWTNLINDKPFLETNNDDNNGTKYTIFAPPVSEFWALEWLNGGGASSSFMLSSQTLQGLVLWGVRPAGGGSAPDANNKG